MWESRHSPSHAFPEAAPSVTQGTSGVNRTASGLRDDSSLNRPYAWRRDVHMLFVIIRFVALDFTFSLSFILAFHLRFDIMIPHRIGPGGFR